MNNNGIILGLLGFSMYLLGLAGLIFGVTTNAGTYQLTCVDIGPQSDECRQRSSTESEQTEPDEENRSLIQKIIYEYNPIKLVFDATGLGDTFAAITAAINGFFQLIFAGIISYLMLAAFQADIAPLYAAVLTFPLNGFVIYTIWRMIRGGG